MVSKIAIGCPVRNRAWVLPDYLAALDGVRWPNKHYIFLENGSDDDTPQILRNWIPRGNYPFDVKFLSTPDAPGEGRNEYDANGYAHLARVRNDFLKLFLRLTDADYLLSVDSDVIVPPDIVEKLLPLAVSKTIVAAAISNIPGKPLDGHTPGNFMIEQSGAIIHPPSYPMAGTMEVDVNGAVYLIPRHAIEDGIRYAPHSCGEDIPFCQQAQKQGYKLIVCFDVKPEHRMTRDDET